MELFSEIYGRYYRAVKELLLQSQDHPLCTEEMGQIIRKYAFSESDLTILPKLKSGEWDLINQTEDGRYQAKIKRPPHQPLSSLQRSWLTSILKDPRITLFLEESEVESLRAKLKDCDPLYDSADFYYFDRAEKGDPYESEEYRIHFRLLQKAIQNSEILTVQWGEELLSICPFKLQYLPKADRFYVYAVQRNKDNIKKDQLLRLPLSEIEKITTTGKKNRGTVRLEALLQEHRAKEPILIQIFTERNALERCMLQFAEYEKQTEKEEDGSYLCKIFYDIEDEKALLDEILSFGPLIKVLGPSDFLEKIIERVKRQKDLLESLT